jgi:glycosyltransferase involved in cell wall biosynthesis
MPVTAQRTISAVIPLLDEADSLPELHAQLDTVAREHGYDLEIIFVDDGSKDGSWQAIEKLSARSRELPSEDCVPGEAHTTETFDAERLARLVK